MKGFHQLKWEDRIRLEMLLRQGHSKSEVARQLGVNRSTVYNELRRGSYMHRKRDYLKDEMRYSPEIAQRRCEENLKVRGTQLKIGNDIAYANYLEEKIAKEGYSPEAVLGELKASGKDKEFNTSICVVTLYSYIDKGVFFSLTNKDLPAKRYKKRTYHKVKVQKRVREGDSIEKRPCSVDDRIEFGHWEMDSVIGKLKKGAPKNTLLVLTERKTRYELIFKQKDKTAESVVRTLDALERRWGAELFRKVFRTITVDNGQEFSDCRGIERSYYGQGDRTKLYYCHPFCSYERGSNENNNKMVRRHYPKGTEFDKVSPAELEQVQDWINTYPRRMFKYRNAKPKLYKKKQQLEVYIKKEYPDYVFLCGIITDVDFPVFVEADADYKYKDEILLCDFNALQKAMRENSILQSTLFKRK